MERLLYHTIYNPVVHVTEYWVLRLSIWQGQPVGADPQHIYICEYRVDKSARLFAKLAKSKTPPVCLKSFAFDKYDQRRKISRTYTVSSAGSLLFLVYLAPQGPTSLVGQVYAVPCISSFLCVLIYNFLF